MHFTKMHGLGNDYVYVDCVRRPPPRDPAALSRRISDRHFGVGSDGLILICPSERADVRMQIFNADGSEGEMCGNGIRCVAKYAYERGIAVKPRLTVETGRGVLTLDLTVAAGRVESVCVDMGEPLFRPEQIPTTLPGERVVNVPLPDWPDGSAIRASLGAAGAEPNVTCVCTGNPHAVFYCRNVAEVPLDFVGPVLENAPFFPRRANIHFVQVIGPSEVVMRTWERGSGITLACGTGASAVCVAGVLTRRTLRKLLAHLPGGDLQLAWCEQNNHVYKTGPAVEVFDGDWPDA